MRKFFLITLTISTIASFILWVILALLVFDPMPNGYVHWDSVAPVLIIVGIVQAFCLLMTLASLGSYFGSDIWRSKRSMDIAAAAFVAKDRQLDTWIHELGKATTRKVLRDAGIDWETEIPEVKAYNEFKKTTTEADKQAVHKPRFK